VALAWQKNLEIKEEQMSIRVNTCEEHDNCLILYEGQRDCPICEQIKNLEKEIKRLEEDVARLNREK